MHVVHACTTAYIAFWSGIYRSTYCDKREATTTKGI